MNPNSATGGWVPFPETGWAHVLNGGCGDTEAGARALEELCRQYWPAIYSYLRALGLGKEEAEDTAQEFVTEFMVGGLLQRADPDRGRLRGYIRKSVRHFLANRRRGGKCLKRGGALEHVAWDSVPEGEQPAHGAPPDQTYDREWALTVMERAMASLRNSYASRGRQAMFDLIQPSLASTDALEPYAAIGLSAGMHEDQIKVEIHRARRRLAGALRREVAATVASAGEVEEELRYLLTVLAYGC